VLADNLSEAAIIDAIRHGRTIVNLHGPDDPAVEFTARGKGGATAQIGDDVSGVAEATLDIHVTGGSGDFVDLMRDGVKVQHVAVTTDDFKRTLTDGTAGPHRYRVQLIDPANRPLVITSHIYIDAAGAEAGCGCSSSNPGGSGVLVLVGLLALRRRR
jgi:MYXO-CTERM domain-containing protein